MLQPAPKIAGLKVVLLCQQYTSCTSLVTEEGLAEKRGQAINIYRKLFVISRISCLTVLLLRKQSHQSWTQTLIHLVMSTNSKSDYIGSD